MSRLRRMFMWEHFHFRVCLGSNFEIDGEIDSFKADNSLPYIGQLSPKLSIRLICQICNILFKFLHLRLNAVREICSRCPLVMNEDLLRDLAQYKNYKERSVMMAARSLIHLYRASMPELLHKKDRVCTLITWFDQQGMYCYVVCFI
jgi:hypothetical protein